ncbi:hypothetical protein AGMMS50267_11130 [Spirochaetia bacterium]|nr:hypothetical protein AGMMS50267_11130 [Spirochaetia bacterium]
MRKLSLLWIVPLLLLTACGELGDLPFAMPEIAGKGYRYLDTAGKQQFRKIEVIVYVDTAKYNPLNALDYTLKTSGTPFFDYVILGSAYVKRTEKAPYLVLSGDLQKVLERRKTLVEPLQRKGIKILLGITCDGDKISLGSMNDDEMLVFSEAVFQTLEIYGLDGVEFYDSGADPSMYPIENYNLSTAEGIAEAEDALEQWVKGGDNLNNLGYLMQRNYDTSPRERVIVLREANFARYLKENISFNNGADYYSPASQLDYTINARFDKFVPLSASRSSYSIYDTPDDPVGRLIQDDQYGPLAIDLDGGSSKNIFYPYMEMDAGAFVPGMDNSRLGQDISGYTASFKDRGDYHVIYYHNLKAASETIDDPFYRWLFWNSGLPTSPEFTNDRGTITSNPKYVPLLFLFDQLAQQLFGEGVVCTGGDYLKDW